MIDARVISPRTNGSRLVMRNESAREIAVHGVRRERVAGE